ncbi:MAG: hypothetical protein HQL27_08945 [Candidatus Omnitrophica bacterium]|nr:hypothetical protein [Candidatus Omnitrophota bacterium]
MTFIEVAIAIVILSSGIVAVFRSFLYCLDQTRYITNRLYADNFLENRLDKISVDLKLHQALPVSTDDVKSIDLKPTPLKIKQSIEIKEVDDFLDIFQIDLYLSWNENGREIRLSRSAYLSEF